MFVFAVAQFSQIGLAGISHPQNLIALNIWSASLEAFIIPQVMSDHLGLPSAGILLGKVN